MKTYCKMKGNIYKKYFFYLFIFAHLCTLNPTGDTKGYNIDYLLAPFKKNGQA